MNKNRLEAFSDGVLAIIITIMVLEIRVPHGSDWSVLQPLLPTLVSYILSFTFIGICWVNHHHLLHALKKVTTGILWANINLLFWLSLIPFATGWMGESRFAANTVSLYGALLLGCGVAFTILQYKVEKNMYELKGLKTAFRNLKVKGIASTIGYISAIPLAYVNPIISGVIFLAISVMWLAPDRNIAKALSGEREG